MRHQKPPKSDLCPPSPPPPPGFTNASAGDLSLKNDSPARSAGLDLSTITERKLPDCQPGYFQGERPDIGALQYGEPMPRLPRPAPVSK
ncbi:hypothetical protein Ga0100231_010730 [Opitutaceae bacterium TAV4]|nr:hypothetical protein Ga0100231_010730 [Opitutaceae bacterium TAV4]